jgi:triacylglycerol esterase/lipase EstA (alpha/beta hydrolase family)
MFLTLAPAGADDGPSLSVPTDAIDAALHCPATFMHPEHEPVLLVHGLGATGVENWGWNYALALPAAGFDVCTVDLPGRAWNDIQVSSEYVVHAVRVISTASGKQVDVVGHSEGGLQPRWAVRWWRDVRERVDDIVTLGSPHHGVFDPDVVDLPCPIPCIPGALWQMREGSRFLTALNAGDETPDPVSYTSIWSATDELVQGMSLGKPTSVLEGASNFMVQDLCPGRFVSHVGLATDAVTHAVVIDALTHEGPAAPSRFDPLSCLRIDIPGLDYTALRGDPVALLLAPLTAERLTWEPELREYVRQDS